MAVPDYETLMLPVIKHLADGKPHKRPEVTRAMADEFQLSEDERKQLLPSGKVTVIGGRTGWAMTYLKQAGVLQTPTRGVYVLADRGRNLLTEAPDLVDAKYLERFPEFIEFRNRRHTSKGTGKVPGQPERPAEEVLEEAYDILRKELQAEILQRVKSASPEFFEQLVVELLVSMGYGGSLKDAGKAVGRSGDEGIDGIVKEDRLGLDVIYLQAKRWENVVSRPEIQKFAGALQGHRAKKGVFITTSTFSQEAKTYSANIDNKIVLIDGHQLAELMFEHNLGLSTEQLYEVKRIDGDFFTDE